MNLKCRWSLTRPVAYLLLLAMALLGTSCGSLSSRVVYDPAPAAARLRAGGGIQEEANRLAQPLIAKREIYGAVVGVLTPDGGAQVYRYGQTGRLGDTNAPDGASIFEVGSLSKLFVASLLAILVEEGALRYDDNLRSILPDSVPLSKDAGELTLYELVTHTGGLPAEPLGRVQFYYFARYLFTGRNLYGYVTKDYTYEYLRTFRLVRKGKRHYVYSNFGAGLLAHLLEVKTGRPFPDLVAEKICRPLNMRDTGYALQAEQRRRLVVGHVGDQPKFIRRNTPTEAWDMGEIMRGTGGLYSTANDLLIFARANLGRLHAPLEPVLASTHRLQFTTSEEGVALGWLINYFDQGRLRVIYKHGMVAGYSAYLGMNEEFQIAVVVLCGNFNWKDKIGHNLVLRISDWARAEAQAAAAEHSPPSSRPELLPTVK